MGPTGDGPPRDRRLRSPSPVADTALYPEAPRPDRIRSRSTTHPKGPTTRLTAPAYWKFESISLQRGVLCEPDSSPAFGPHSMQRRRCRGGDRSAAAGYHRRLDAALLAFLRDDCLGRDVSFATEILQ